MYNCHQLELGTHSTHGFTIYWSHPSSPSTTRFEHQARISLAIWSKSRSRSRIVKASRRVKFLCYISLERAEFFLYCFFVQRSQISVDQGGQISSVKEAVSLWFVSVLRGHISEEPGGRSSECIPVLEGRKSCDIILWKKAESLWFVSWGRGPKLCDSYMWKRAEGLWYIPLLKGPNFCWLSLCNKGNTFYLYDCNQGWLGHLVDALAGQFIQSFDFDISCWIWFSKERIAGFLPLLGFPRINLCLVLVHCDILFSSIVNG